MGPDEDDEHQNLREQESEERLPHLTPEKLRDPMDQPTQDFKAITTSGHSNQANGRPDAGNEIKILKASEKRPEGLIQAIPTAESKDHSKDQKLKIFSWNVAGLRASMKKSLLEILRIQDAHIVALQETRCPPRKRPKSIALEGYYGYFKDGKISGYAGVATLSKSEPLANISGIGDEDCDGEGRALMLEFKDYFVVNAYVPNSGQHLVTLDKRLAWNEKFKQFLTNLDQKKPVILCGDLNVAHTE